MGAIVSGRAKGLALAAPLAAAIGCLQPGIEPVFLSLLTDATGVPIEAHGIVVGGTQAGAAVGSLTAWRLGSRLPFSAIVIGAALALLCSLATPFGHGLFQILALRSVYGLAMGLTYATAMASHAERQPNTAYGLVFLVQLVLSTLISIVLPEAEAAFGAKPALAALAFAPAVAFAALLALAHRRARSPATHHRDETRAPVPRAGWALAAATFWFICSTMLVWSFSAALATTAGIEDRTIGHAVAIGSLVGAVTALAVMREKLLVPLPVTALLAGASLAAPVLCTAPGQETAFVISIVLLNIGSTAIIIRCSGLATATSRDSRFRIFVACTHSLGLICGPLLGSVMMASSGATGLLWGLAFTLVAGLASVGIARFGTFPRGFDAIVSRFAGDPSKRALD